MRFYTHLYWGLAAMTKTNPRVSPGTLLRAAALLLGVMLVSSCGIELSGKEKPNGATTPSPTEETVINGRA